MNIGTPTAEGCASILLLNYKTYLLPRIHGIKTHISIVKNMLNEENKEKKLPYNYLEMDF